MFFFLGLGVDVNRTGPVWAWSRRPMAPGGPIFLFRILMFDFFFLFWDIHPGLKNVMHNSGSLKNW